MTFFDLQVIPQAICTQYGLSVGANLVWLVRILMFICYPITYPIAKVFLYSYLFYFHNYSKMFTNFLLFMKHNLRSSI